MILLEEERAISIQHHLMIKIQKLLVITIIIIILVNDLLNDVNLK